MRRETCFITPLFHPTECVLYVCHHACFVHYNMNNIIQNSWYRLYKTILVNGSICLQLFLIIVTREQLLCSICLEVFTDPATTPCGHNYCKSCLIERKTGRDSEADRGDTEWIRVSGWKTYRSAGAGNCSTEEEIFSAGTAFKSRKCSFKNAC